MKRRLVSAVLVLSGVAAGIAVAKLWPGGAGSEGATVTSAVANASQKKQVWTCSMHPQIRMDHPGLCPLCGMDLTPVSPDEQSAEADQLTLGERARMMARVGTSPIGRRELFKELRTVGRIALDETRVANIAAWVDGRVDQVFADFPGTAVRKGEHLVSIYSPELYSTQQEFLAAIRRDQQWREQGRGDAGTSLSAASRERLALWGITAEQIDELARSGKAQTHLTVYAPIGGTVIEKNIRAGQYVKQGDMLYTIADLGHVWLVLEIYESELSWVRLGQAVQVSLESEPNRPVTGSVAFIEPTLNQETRTVQVRVILDNPDGKFKPGMYAQALVRVPIMPDGGPAPTGLEGKYICPMHPYVVSEGPGTCDVCKMPLEQVPGGPATDPHTLHPQVLAVPAEAVLTTGRRQLVYVERQPGEYQLVEPKLGPRAGDYFPVVGGLKEGDRAVVRGNFLLDSQFQITGKPSLLYPYGSMGDAGHEGHGVPAAAEPREPGAKEQANLDKLPPEDRELALKQKTCPITGELLGSMGVPYKMLVKGRAVFLCCQGCEYSVEQDPEGTLKKIDGGMTKE